MTSAKEMELLILVKKGLEADKILNNTQGYDCTFEEFKKIKSDSDLGKKAKEAILSIHDEDVKKIVNYLMSDKNNGKKVKIFSSDMSNKEDYYQEGLIALAKAIDTFDSSKKTSLFTYAFTKIVYAIITEATKDENISDKDKKMMNDVKRIKNIYASENKYFDEYTIAEELKIDIEEVKRIEKIIELNKKSKVYDNTDTIENDEQATEKKLNEQKTASLFEYLSPEETDFIEYEFKFKNSYTKDELCQKYNINDSDLDDRIKSIIKKMKLGVSISKKFANNIINEEEYEIIKFYYNFNNSLSYDELCKNYKLDSTSYNEKIDIIIKKIEGCA